jgi:hypothetical protein
VLQRIAEQIFKDISKTQLVSHNGRSAQRHVNHKSDPAIHKSGSHRINGLQNQLFGSHGMKLHPGLPRFNSADIQQVFNNPVKPVAVFTRRSQDFCLFGRQRTKLLA